MPYFVYEIAGSSDLKFVDVKDKYGEARALVRDLRERQHESTGVQFRMAFARTRAEAEKLLSTPRDERVIGED